MDRPRTVVHVLSSALKWNREHPDDQSPTVSVRFLEANGVNHYLLVDAVVSTGSPFILGPIPGGPLPIGNDAFVDVGLSINGSFHFRGRVVGPYYATEHDTHANIFANLNEMRHLQETPGVKC